MKNKYVTVFSWPEPVLQGLGKATFMSANKFAFLENAVSPPTDENGITEFSNLTIKGSTD